MRRRGNCALPLLVCAASMMITGVAHAKHRQLSREELIRTAEIIAVVDVDSDEAIPSHGAAWEYRRKSSVRLVSAVKGAPAPRFDVATNEDYACETTLLVPGKRWLLFLHKDGDYLAIVNHLTGQLLVDERNQVRWFNGANDGHARRMPRSLDDVLKEIATIESQRAVRPVRRRGSRPSR
jgi:hypothetical protein